jgi:diguanylate cyclase (GGDEF)-like protein/PAS domain S-box-containing protein
LHVGPALSADANSKVGKLRGLLGRGATGESRGAAQSSDRHHALMLLHDYEASGLGWFWSTDGQGRVTYISECVAQKLGKSRAEVVGQLFHSLFIIERDEDDIVERTLPLILSTRKIFAELAIRAASGHDDVWWSISGRPQYDASGEYIGFRGNGSDITASRQSRKDAARLAMYDSLTGLSNRHRTARRLDATLIAYQAAKRSCALMMMDLDRFKAVNDTLGHQAGDELLKQVAQRLQQVVRETGCEIGRLGGDEFQIMLPDIDDRGRLGEIAKAIIAMISQPYSVAGARCVIGTSIGVAIAPYDGLTSEELVRNADLALYAAKGGGRGQFRFYASHLHSEAERRRQIEEDLRDALQKDQMWLAYQPVVSCQDNRVVAFEALLRWDHPELGDVSPSIFIPIAEECNLIAIYGDWALRRACEEAASWPSSVRIAVNVSSTQFSNPNFLGSVTQALASSGLEPNRLELELTESIFLGDDSDVTKTFNSLKMLGVRLALDDFGTGYSSLGYLRKVDFDKIKVDRGFIEGVTEPNSRNAAIIRSVVSLAEGLKMDTTAEGVEAHDELDMMKELGIKTIQGYIYSKPVTETEVREAMLSGEWMIEPSGPDHYRTDRRTVLLKVGLIHEDHRYEGTMRNLSRSGALIDGLIDIPLGTQFVVDFGEGQLAVATVRRSAGTMQGLEFEVPLVDDGAGGLCTRHRVSPYMLAQAGMPLGALPPGQYPLTGQGPAGFSLPRFAHVEDQGRVGQRVAG